jgi:hypothetical protein
MPAQSNKPIAPERIRHRFRGKDYLCPVIANVIDEFDASYLGLSEKIYGTNLNPIDLENWSYGWSLSFQRYGPDPRFFEKTWDLIVSRGPKPRKA